jgi:hypothetical protein
MQRIVFVLLFLGLFLEPLSAQLIRRQLQRIPGFPGEPIYRVGPALRRAPIIQGDGRAAERVMNIVGLFTGAEAGLKPVIVVSFSSFDEYRRVIQIVAQQIRLDKGSFDEPVLLNMALNLYERVVGQGFDTSQPLGVVLQTDGVLFYPIMFTPLNLDSKMGQSLQKQYAEHLPDGRTVIRQEVFRWPLGRLYVQEHNGWAFIAPENLLNSLPDDPTVLLQGLDRTALMAARFDLQNMPALSTRAALTLGEMNAVAQAETEIDKAAARLGIGYIRSLAEQADFLEYTFSYDEKQNDYIFVQKEIVKPNTERAKLMQERRGATSSLHGFYNPNGAILASHYVMSLTKTQREQLEIILDESIGKHLLTEEERKALKLSGAGVKQPAAVIPNEPLSELLAQVSPEEREQIMQPETLEIVEPALPDMVWNEDHLAGTPANDLTDAQKLEMLFRRIGAAYYWALIGAVRSGQFDGASTCSQEHGILAAYNIADGEQFQKAFDAIFAEMQEKFPNLYEKNVQKDYAESEGFRLTSVVFRLGDFIKNPFLRSITPPRLAERETRLILGVRKDAVCFAVGQGLQPEKVLVKAMGETKVAKPVSDLFFVYSAYELGQAFASSGRPERFVRLKLAALDTNPSARAYAVSQFTETTKTITFRASGLLTPSLWRLREAMW